MSYYRRARDAGGTYFFTVVSYRRQKILCDEPIRDALREGIEKTRQRYPFEIDAWVLLPDHLHCLWTLPEGDADFSKRWAKIKRHVSLVCGDHYKRNDWMSDSNKKHRESTLWQRRFWEQSIWGQSKNKRQPGCSHPNPLPSGGEGENYNVINLGFWFLPSALRCSRALRPSSGSRSMRSAR